MLAEPDLRAVLSALPLVSVHGPWSRIVGAHLLAGPPPGDAPEAPPRPLWPGGAPLYGARFTPLDGAATVYLASDVTTALLEVQALVQVVAGPPVLLNRQPWTLLTVDGLLTSVLDLTAPDSLARLGTNVSELTGEWRLTQALGGTPPTHLLGRVAFETGGIEAIRYPSAKNPAGGTGLAVFAERLVPGGPSYLEAIDPHGRLGERIPS